MTGKPQSLSSSARDEAQESNQTEQLQLNTDERAGPEWQLAVAALDAPRSESAIG